MTEIIQAENIRKAFWLDRPLHKRLLLPFGRRERIEALKSVSFSLEAGQILGVVGPNGAGKTTLLRILADLLEPEAGSVRILGRALDTNGRSLRKKIGYVSSDERSFFWRLTGRENLEFFARLYGLSHRQARERTSELLAQFDFGEKADQLFRDYSAGMRKKISVMRALLHRPAVLLLDEVTNSLDPASAKMVKGLVREYVSTDRHRGAVWSTHRLEEICQICDRVITIELGRIRRQGPVRDFKASPEGSTDYLLRTRNMDGQFDAFCRRFGCIARVNRAKDGSINEFIFGGISEAEFSRIVTVAVKDLGAYIIFAGCIEKNPEKVLGYLNDGTESYDDVCP